MLQKFFLFSLATLRFIVFAALAMFAPFVKGIFSLLTGFATLAFLVYAIFAPDRLALCVTFGTALVSMMLVIAYDFLLYWLSPDGLPIMFTEDL